MLTFYIIAQLIFDIWILYYIFSDTSAKQAVKETIQTIKPQGYDPPRCAQCGTIQNVIRYKDKFLCRMCLSHAA